MPLKKVLVQHEWTRAHSCDRQKFMSWNTFGRVLRFTTWGESHGAAIGAVVDGCPPGIELAETDIQPFLDARKPGQNKFTKIGRAHV